MNILKYPVEIVFVDDDRGFLKDMSSYCSKYFPHIQTFTSASKFLTFIKRNYKIKKDIDIIENVDNYNEKELSFVIKINEFLKLKFFKKNNPVAVVVIDENLDEESGLKVIEEVKNQFPNSNISWILLTGYIKNSKGMELLNFNKTDSFLEKSTHGLEEKLKKHIEHGMDCYFKKMTSLLLKNRAKDKGYNAITESFYKDLLGKIISEYNAVEYYPIDTRGSLLLFDKKGEAYTFLIVSNKTISAQVELLKDMGADEKNLIEIRKKKKTFYYTQTPIAQDFKELYLHKTANNNFMYEVFKGDVLDLKSHFCNI